MKIVSNCPLCEERALHIVEDQGVDTQQCISCGYATSVRYKLDDDAIKEDNEMYQQLTDEMKVWSKVGNNRIWIPTIMTLPFGMLYPTTTSNMVNHKKELQWGYAKMVDIKEEEQKDYPIPGEEGKYYTRKYDTDGASIYDEFYLAMMEINEEAKKRNKKEVKAGKKLSLPKLKRM